MEREEKKLGRPSKQNIPMYVASYIEKKIKMLKNEFHIRLTEEELARFWECTTEAQVDAHAHKLFLKYL